MTGDRGGDYIAAAIVNGSATASIAIFVDVDMITALAFEVHWCGLADWYR